MINAFQKILLYGVSFVQRTMLLLCFCLFSTFVFSQKTSISSGYSHSLYLCPEGELYSWGDNLYGQLAWGDIGESYPNMGKITSLQNVVFATAALGFHSLAVRSDSSLWTWGLNNYGQLGNDDYCSDRTAEACINNIIPLRVEGGETGENYLRTVLTASGGMSQSYALLATGEVVAWGDNVLGQLGNGNFRSSYVPRYVRTSNGSRLKHIKMIAAGGYFGYALDSSGFVWAWGDNTHRQLACGNDNNKAFATPVLTSSGNQLHGVIKLAAGEYHGLFLSSNGTVWAAGDYKGLTSFFKASVYVQLVGGGQSGLNVLQGVSDISAGMVHSLAVVHSSTGSKQLMSWGYNKFYRPIDKHGGQLGLGSLQDTNRTEPSYVLYENNDTVRNVLWISAGCANSFAYVYDQFDGQARIYACGANNSFQLGFASSNDYFRLTPLFLPDCKYNCPSAFMGADMSLCTPFSTVLHSGSRSLQNIYQWKRNDTILKDTNYALTATKPGLYTVSISRRTYNCGVSIDTLQLLAKRPPFTIIKNNFCADTLHLNVFGSAQFSWWDAPFYGRQLSSNASLRCLSSSAYQLPNDSVMVWLQTNVCQRMPVSVTRDCACKLPAPKIRDTVLCSSDLKHISLPYDSLIFYKDSHFDTVLSIGRIPFELSQQKKTIITANYIQNGCQSAAAQLQISSIPCLLQYSISGRIIPAIAARVFLYDIDLPSNPIDSIDIEPNTPFQFISYTGYKTIKVCPIDTSQFTSSWFYNATEPQKAKTIKLVANISGLQLPLQQFNSLKKSIFPDLFITPNPVDTKLYINLPSNDLVQNLVLRSTDGQLIIPQFVQNNSQIILDVTHLASGVYWLELLQNSVYRSPFIKI